MNNRSQNLGLSRRRFLAAAGLAVAAPVIVPSSVLGADGATAPSNRIVMGAVGWGMQGPGNTGSFMNQKDCQVVAVCDLDKNICYAARGITPVMPPPTLCRVTELEARITVIVSFSRYQRAA